MPEKSELPVSQHGKKRIRRTDKTANSDQETDRLVSLGRYTAGGGVRFGLTRWYTDVEKLD
jgi:hypothetical protein